LFVESEKIVSGDYGLFVLSAPHTLEMKLFDSNGNEKPMPARPPSLEFIRCLWRGGWAA